MPIPAFSIDGVLPPYVGSGGPGGAPQDMTPYVVTAVEVVLTLGTSPKRRTILAHWLDHRAALRGLGFQRGFQWLDGSFVEEKEPNDLDIVTFLFRPATVLGHADLGGLIGANAHLFDRPQVKTSYMLDAFFIDLDASPEGIVNVSRYWLGLFSHRRADGLWKGMLQVRLATFRRKTRRTWSIPFHKPSLSPMRSA
jgi:hypothetical protein